MHLSQAVDPAKSLVVPVVQGVQGPLPELEYVPAGHRPGIVGSEVGAGVGCVGLRVSATVGSNVEEGDLVGVNVAFG
jgi:hypothetical protein